jgi:hypothetical protein
MDFEANGANLFMWMHFFPINLLFRAEVRQRRGFPLGDESYLAPLLKANHAESLDLEPAGSLPGKP